MKLNFKNMHEWILLLISWDLHHQKHELTILVTFTVNIFFGYPVQLFVLYCKSPSTTLSCDCQYQRPDWLFPITWPNFYISIGWRTSWLLARIWQDSGGKWIGFSQILPACWIKLIQCPVSSIILKMRPPLRDNISDRKRPRLVPWHKATFLPSHPNLHSALSHNSWLKSNHFDNVHSISVSSIDLHKIFWMWQSPRFLPALTKLQHWSSNYSTFLGWIEPDPSMYDILFSVEEPQPLLHLHFLVNHLTYR